MINSPAIKQELGSDQLSCLLFARAVRAGGAVQGGQLVSPVKKVDSKVVVLSRLRWSHGCVKEPVMAGQQTGDYRARCLVCRG